MSTRTTRMRTRDLIVLFSDAVEPGTRTIETKEFIFRQGEFARSIFGVETGQVKLERNTMEGRAAIMQIAGADECFAEAALFSDVYHCDAVATMQSRIVSFSKEDVLRTLRTNPRISLDYTALLSDQVRALRAQLELKSILSARERILKYLALHADPETNVFRLSGTLKELAAEIGLAHESFYRQLKKLTEEGLIERGKDGQFRLVFARSTTRPYRR